MVSWFLTVFSTQLKVYGTENTTEPNLESIDGTNDDNTSTGITKDDIIFSVDFTNQLVEK